MTKKVNLTGGDWLGISGTILGAVTQMGNTLSNIKATRKSVNRYKGFNDRALSVNKMAQERVSLNKSAAKSELERSLASRRNTAKVKNRQTASSINTLRGLDLATELGLNDTQTQGNLKIDELFGNEMLNLLAGQEKLLSQKDSMEMSGQEKADNITDANLDNAYTQFGRNLGTMTTNMQKLGSDLNKNLQSNDFLDILSQMSSNGLYWDKSTGKWQLDVSADRSNENPIFDEIEKKPVDLTTSEPSGLMEMKMKTVEDDTFSIFDEIFNQ